MASAKHSKKNGWIKTEQGWEPLDPRMMTNPHRASRAVGKRLSDTVYRIIKRED